ncbi:MAG: hypothetical protein QNJ63_18690 [Calothrix sp. MO_192.B10]|nr:hypothetical protein [Calothrix sp. MO_192.B10]
MKEEDKAIQELVKSPLTLNIIAVAYKDKSREELLTINSLSERRNHLLDTYIERRFEERIEDSKKLKYTETQSRHWLNWLAQKMTNQSQEVLLIEQIQPDWLQTTAQKWMYLIGSRFILGLIVGLIAFLHFSTLVTSNLGAQISLVIPSVIAGLASGLSSLVLSIFIPRIIRRFRPRHISRFIPRAIRDRFKLQDISRFIPGVMSGLIYVIIAAPMVYAIVEKSYKWREVISPLIIDGFVLGIFFTLISQEIGIIDTIKTSREKAIKYSVVGLIWGSIYVLARLLFSNRYDLGNLDDLFDIFIELLIFTILPGLIGFLDKGVNLEQTIIPNQGVWRSANNACLFFGIFFPVGMLCSLNYVKGQNHEVISIGLAVGLLAGLVGGKGPVFAGLVLIQHFTLRVILWLQGYTPWNYARFLDYATERIFLRKVGGGYIFIHQTLKEHFAQKE